MQALLRCVRCFGSYQRGMIKKKIMVLRLDMVIIERSGRIVSSRLLPPLVLDQISSCIEASGSWGPR